jgi:ubiquitin-conjugating enzyme E2 M
LALPKTMTIEFPNGRDDLMNFIITIKPDSGYYAHGVFRFTFAVPAMYPHEPPKVRCEQKVYHPNIDLDGNVCLNILREDWKPVLSISSILFGLSLLFAEPNPHDPLNKEAAEELVRTPRNFELNVRRAMQGGYVGSHRYSAVLR